MSSEFDNQSIIRETDAIPSLPETPTERTATGLLSKIQSAAAKPKSSAPENFLLDKLKAASALASAKNAKKNMPAISKGPREQLTFSIQRPNSKKFSRVHPGEEYSQMNVPVLIDPDDNGKYFFVMPGVEETLPDFVAEGIRYIDLYAAVDHTGSKFIWPVKQSETTWYLGATKAVNKARKHWVSVRAVKGANTYEVSQPINPIAEPNWASFPSWGEMIESAFHERIVMGPTDRIVVTLAGGSHDDDEE